MRAFVLACLLPAGLAACASMGRLAGDVQPFPATVPSPAEVHAALAASAPPPVAAAQAGDGGGSIYAAAGQNRGLKLFQDNKARHVGDLLTIVLVERTTSASTAQTSVTKESGVDMPGPTIAGMPVTYHGRNLLEIGLEGSRDFAGSGDSTQSNRLDGHLTVTVVQDLGNGNLLVSGQKQLRLNQGDEVVQVQGIVRVADIGPDNRIPSTRVADARIVHGGRGTLARSNAMGWLSRFFNSALYPY